MGWSNGPRLASEVWSIVRPHVTLGRRVAAREIIQAFCGYDADDWCDQLELMEDAGFPMDGEDDEIDRFWDELRS
jgi:hypothetical protein